MAESFQKFPIGTQAFQGYKSDAVNCPPNYLSTPSRDCVITKNGKAESRLGYQKSSPHSSIYSGVLTMIAEKIRAVESVQLPKDLQSFLLHLQTSTTVKQ